MKTRIKVEQASRLSPYPGKSATGWKLVLLGLALCTLNLPLATALAQNTRFIYQGLATVNGTNLTAVGQFKFALVTSTNANHTATATASPPSGGLINSYTVTSGGNGYLTAPAVTVSGGGGTGATAHAVLSGNAVSDVIADNFGDGNYTSAPTVTIAPPPPAFSYRSYWSNDGTSDGGSEPSAAVHVAVSNGLFTVVLGDTTVPNMATMDASLFTQPNLQLRIWFSDGVDGFAALDPVQNLTPTPYAVAANSASNLLGTVSAAQLNGPIASANVAGTYGNAVTFENVSNSFSGNGGGLTALNASQLASGTVPDAQLSVNVARTNQVWLLGGNAGTTPAAGNFVGTTDNQPLEFRVNNRRGLRLEPAGSNSVNVIGGWSGNGVMPGVAGATIGGGGAGNYFGFVWSNRVESDFGTVSGGTVNTIQAGARYANIGGGWNNMIESNAYSAAVYGGQDNTIQARAYESTISGGHKNVIKDDAQTATISGGEYNTVETAGAVVGGGYFNTIQSNSLYTTVAGGNGNTIETNDDDSTIGGGGGNTIETAAAAATIAGGDGNKVLSNSGFTVIGGGLANVIENDAVESTISGGRQNTIQTNAPDSFIGGGLFNTIQLYSGGSVIGGGYGNLIQPSTFLGNGALATISGGLSNSVSGYGGTVAGGVNNQVGNSGLGAVGGGTNNTASAFATTIGGGANNTASAWASTVGGGYGNTASSPDGSATVGGGYLNTASGDSSTVPGGASNIASGAYSFAAGHQAQALHTGAFVWSDASSGFSSSFASTADNQFSVRASGGTRFYSDAFATTGVTLAPGSGSWTMVSDRNAKENFAPINALAVLAKVAALPLSTWNYKSQPAAIRHIGPMAQDFKAAFHVGATDKGITTVDAQGVAFAAIQGLNQKLQEESKAKDLEIENQNTEIQSLRHTMEELKRLVNQLAEHKKGNKP